MLIFVENRQLKKKIFVKCHEFRLLMESILTKELKKTMM